MQFAVLIPGREVTYVTDGTARRARVRRRDPTRYGRVDLELSNGEVVEHVHPSDTKPPAFLPRDEITDPCSRCGGSGTTGQGWFCRECHGDGVKR